MKLWKPLRIGRPGQGDYLWRLNLIRLAGYSVKVHRFLRSDLDECLHDHPWPFATLILSGGYFEVTDSHQQVWHPPGSFLIRPAQWRHRVMVPVYPCQSCAWCAQWAEKGKEEPWPEPFCKCKAPHRVTPLTLFFAARKCRPWGFHTTRGFVRHEEFEGC